MEDAYSDDWQCHRCYHQNFEKHLRCAHCGEYRCGNEIVPSKDVLLKRLKRVKARLKKGAAATAGGGGGGGGGGGSVAGKSSRHRRKESSGSLKNNLMEGRYSSDNHQSVLSEGSGRAMDAAGYIPPATATASSSTTKMIEMTGRQQQQQQQERSHSKTRSNATSHHDNFTTLCYPQSGDDSSANTSYYAQQQQQQQQSRQQQQQQQQQQSRQQQQQHHHHRQRSSSSYGCDIRYDDNNWLNGGHPPSSTDADSSSGVSYSSSSQHHHRQYYAPPNNKTSSRQQQHDTIIIQSTPSMLSAKHHFNQKNNKSNSGSNDSSDYYAHRLTDFRYARSKRRQAYGKETPWGILGLYEHLAGLRTDLEWADELARRRKENEPYIPWSIFDDLKDPTLNKPIFTYTLLFICLIMMFVSMYLNNWQFEPLTINPMLGPSADVLVTLGAKSADLIVNMGEIWRLGTAMILHAGFIHFFLNMIALRYIGAAVEQSHGFIAAAVIFCIPSVGGTILSTIFLPEFISVGASGGIFGYIGACLADIVMNWSLIFGGEVNDWGETCKHIWMVLWLFIDVAINCFIGLTPFIDNFTHMGGMFYGFLCGLALMDRIQLSPTEKTAATKLSTTQLRQQQSCTPCLTLEQQHQYQQTKKSRVLRIMSLVLTLLISSLLVMLTTCDGQTSPYPSLKHMSCVSFPPWNDYYNKWWYCDNCGMTTAEANVQKDEDGESYYAELTLHCPDGSDVENLDLGEYATNNKRWVENMLPFFCREYCENIF